jgi:hypothetical protein
MDAHASERILQHPKSRARRWRAQISAARTSFGWLQDYASHASEPKLEELAQASLDLAIVETIARAGYVTESYSQESIQELATLLGMLPIEEFDRRPLLLNPSFGPLTKALGGGEADIIAGDRLIEVKTSIKRIDSHGKRQLLTHLLMADAWAAIDASAPKIHMFGFYLSRRGTLLVQPAEVVRSKSEFGSLLEQLVTIVENDLTA